MKLVTRFIIAFAIGSVVACGGGKTTEKQQKVVDKEPVVEQKLAKFEPKDGECILFIGQDLVAIGGSDKYSDGYLDHFEAPGGFTMYTNFRPGDESFGLKFKGNDGLTTTDNWGAGPSNMQELVENQKLKNSALAIGLELVNHESKVAQGEHDSLIVDLGKWMKAQAPRPIFLRIGYEFDAHEWNHYDSTAYKAAYRRIKDKYDEMQITNVAYVWQSMGWNSTYEDLMTYYPGDEYVDWCSYTHFSRGDQAKPMFKIAREKKKPIFIAEATPMFEDSTGKLPCFIGKHPEQAKKAWDEWFTSFFKVVDDNPDVVKAISYIAMDWPSEPMWQGEDSPFSMIDARLHVNDYVKTNWLKETSKPKYIKATTDLFDYLYHKKDHLEAPKATR